MTIESLTQLIQAQGLLLLFPLSILEGPIISVIAGWLVRLHLIPLGWTFAVLVLGDLVGDALHYLLGRSGLHRFPERWRRRLGIDDAAIAGLTTHFQDQGGRTLIIGKLTHGLGFAALIAAGAARMPFGRFLWYNLVATLPKTAGFLLLGYLLGHAEVTIGNWIWRVSLIVLILGGAALVWYIRHRTPRP